MLFIGTARGIENRLVPAAGYPLQLVRVGALKNVSLMTRLKTAFDLPRARVGRGPHAERICTRRGDRRGRICLGPGHAGGSNEAHSDAGLRAERCARICQPHGGANSSPARRCISKRPRNIFATRKSRVCRCGRRFSRLLPKRSGTPTLLVFGGSQGAHAINEAMIRCLPVLQREAPGIHIIHQTGERDYNDALAAYSRLGRIRLKSSSLSKTCRQHLRAPI